MDKFLGAFYFLKDRWNEPSSHASISAVCGMIGIQFPENEIGHVFNVAAIAFGALGFFFKEGKAISSRSSSS